MRRTIYITPFVHSLSLVELECVESGVICVSPEGIIEWVEREADVEDLERVAGGYGVDLRDVDVVEFGVGEFLVNGMVDTHTHAPQFPNIGLGGDLQLLDWLKELTFPEEKKYGDLGYAGKVYEEVVGKTLSLGTTTCCYYATIHAESSKRLADICTERGQRAFIGKCCMDRDCPDDYIETTEESINATENFLAHFEHLRHSAPANGNAPKVNGTPSPAPPLVQPILTPRFALSCTPELLSSLSTISNAYTPSLAIQTHLSENPAECTRALELFPECETYAGVYERYGLLHDGTILAHCVHLSEEERVLIKKCGAGISHCPGSNLHLNSGAARVREMLDLGIKVGLGTDCSGGPNPSILSTLRSASHTSRMISFLNTSPTPYKSLSLPELWYLATLGGASLCRLDGVIGNFQVGKEFDALRVGSRSMGMWRGADGEGVRRRFERWVWGGDDRDLGDVWVRGRRVAGSR